MPSTDEDSGSDADDNAVSPRGPSGFSDLSDPGNEEKDDERN